MTEAGRYVEQIRGARRRFGVWRIMEAAINDEDVAADAVMRIVTEGAARMGALSE